MRMFQEFDQTFLSRQLENLITLEVFLRNYKKNTRFHGHFSDFATKSFTAEADLQANIFA